jgi:phosphohistidine swiveling domain-containing protein
VPTLWLKFSDEASLPYPLSTEERRKLEDIYNAADEGSVWNRAAVRLGMHPGGSALVRWHEGVPYVNWSLMTGIISCGSVEVVRASDGNYAYAARATLMRLPALMRSQWRAAQYVEQKLAAALPETRDEKLIESTALGLALQAIMLRLPAHTPRDLAGWLAAPDSAPLKLQRTIRQMQAIQKRRTRLSPAWFELFPKRDGAEPAVPAFFWDEPPSRPVEKIAAIADADKTEWQGLPVCAGQVTGRIFVVRKLKDFVTPDMSDFPVLVFPRARPDTTELFPHASALLFAEGGALSHACTVAREQGIPCVTGLGVDFLDALESKAGQGRVFAAVDGSAGTVRVISK